MLDEYRVIDAPGKSSDFHLAPLSERWRILARALKADGSIEAYRAAMKAARREAEREREARK